MRLGKIYGRPVLAVRIWATLEMYKPQICQMPNRVALFNSIRATESGNSLSGGEEGEREVRKQIIQDGPFFQYPKLLFHPGLVGGGGKRALESIHPFCAAC